ncbi:hypothetical protein VVR12_01745 [Rothia sp. LK2588]|uniref:hypothetical protein n=1 Tax=Rothia sp. LK2588 TaxID=3114369 RepID=UPI0034CDA3C8
MTRFQFFVPLLKDMPIQANRMPRNIGHKIAKINAIQLATISAWRRTGEPTIPTPVRCIASIQRPDNKRYDPNNWAPTTKAMIDALVKTGALIEDNLHVLQGPDHRHHGDGALGVWLTFKDWETL